MLDSSFLPSLPAKQASLLTKPLRIGDVEVGNRVFLAPMSGVSDLPFRRIAVAAGAGLVVSEMIAGEQLAIGNPEAELRAEAVGDGPHVIQLAGREARWMAEGARRAEAAGADIIDINMGCPAKKVTSGASGSALMRDLDHALTLIEATVAATARPVTLKMRLGWDETSINAPELARRAEAAGVAMITVHGRTRCQFFDGTADWAAVAAVKAAVTVPVIVNGDIRSADEADQALALSGADGVMIGRAAYGAPWLPGDIATEVRTGLGAAPLSAGEIVDRALDHYAAILDHYGAAVGSRAGRKHLGWYLDRIGAAGFLISAEQRRQIMTAKQPSQVFGLVRGLSGEAPGRVGVAA